ncbi:MAG: peptide deformylase [Alphaproteobacteria bacterium]
MRKVLSCTHPALRKVAEPVQVDAALLPLLKEMAEIMYTEEGAGLAAPQIGVSKQIIVIDIDDNGAQFFINPQIYWRSEEMDIFDEGCLSVPGVRLKIERHTEIKVKFQDETGKAHDIHATELLAHVLQHEIDHLKGKLNIDYLSPIQRTRILNRIKRDERLQATA